MHLESKVVAFYRGVAGMNSARHETEKAKRYLCVLGGEFFVINGVGRQGGPGVVDQWAMFYFLALLL